MEGFSTANKLQLKTFEDFMSKVDLSIEKKNNANGTVRRYRSQVQIVEPIQTIKAYILVDSVQCLHHQSWNLDDNDIDESVKNT